MEINLCGALRVHTEEQLKELPENHIFVFGSNEAGRHGAGAAKAAVLYFGAELGLGTGIQGTSYALPTLDGELGHLTPPKLLKHIEDFYVTAYARPDLVFVLTKVGCGIAGYANAEEMFAQLFTLAGVRMGSLSIPSNIVFPYDIAQYMRDFVRSA